MNAERRKAINAIITVLEQAAVFDAQINEIATLKDEEQEYYDNMPEGLQSGEKGSAAEEAVSNLQDAEDKLQEIEDGLNEAIDFLRSAAGE
jgi:hypothetical protein